MSHPILVISCGNPADHHNTRNIADYLFSVAGEREVISLLHLGNFHPKIRNAAIELGWRAHKPCSPVKETKEALLNSYLAAVFTSLEAASRFHCGSSDFAKVVVAHFELGVTDLMLLRLIGKIESPCLEIGSGELM